MYKIIGSDGKEYGPINLDRMRQWVSEGRINAHTQIQAPGSQDWKPAGDIPEISSLLAERAGVAGSSSALSAQPPGAQGAPQKGLAITSLVLGILAFLTCFTNIPAIICGHIALNRARRDPGHHGGRGMALTGLILGYISLAVVPIAILAAMLLPALSQAKYRAQSINCMNNMKQIGLAYRTWALDNGDAFPFNVSTNKGGTARALCHGKRWVRPECGLPLPGDVQRIEHAQNTGLPGRHG